MIFDSSNGLLKHATEATVELKELTLLFQVGAVYACLIERHLLDLGKYSPLFERKDSSGHGVRLFKTYDAAIAVAKTIGFRRAVVRVR